MTLAFVFVSCACNTFQLRVVSKDARTDYCFSLELSLVLAFIRNFTAPSADYYFLLSSTRFANSRDNSNVFKEEM